MEVYGDFIMIHIPVIRFRTGRKFCCGNGLDILLISKLAETENAEVRSN